MMSPKRARTELTFKLAVVDLVAAGIYPGPVQLRRHLGSPDGSQTINGRQTQWRRDVLRCLGWHERGWPHHHRHAFIPPLDWPGRLT
jgi:hypothetical protein